MYLLRKDRMGMKNKLVTILIAGLTIISVSGCSLNLKDAGGPVSKPIEQMTNSEKDSYDTSTSESDTSTSESDTNKLIATGEYSDVAKSTEFTLDGKTITLPASVSDFDGFKIDDESDTTTLGHLESRSVLLKNDSGKSIYINIINDSDTKQVQDIEDCTVVGVVFITDLGIDELDVEYNGITLGESIYDVVDKFGEPTKVFDGYNDYKAMNYDRGYITYVYHYEDPSNWIHSYDNELSLDIDNGIITRIELETGNIYK